MLKYWMFNLLNLIDTLYLFTNEPNRGVGRFPSTFTKYIPEYLHQLLTNFSMKQVTQTLEKHPKAALYLNLALTKLNEAQNYDTQLTNNLNDLLILSTALIKEHNAFLKKIDIPDLSQFLQTRPDVIPLPKFRNTPIRLFMTTTYLGNLSLRYDSLQAVQERRQKLVKILKVQPERTIHFRLANGNQEIRASEFLKIAKDYSSMIPKYRIKEDPVGADAIIFDAFELARNYGAFFLVGDCSILTIYDPVTTLWAFAHVGKHNITHDLLGNVINAMRSLGVDPTNLKITVGPAIYMYSYQYDHRILELNQNPYWTGLIKQVSPDLYTLNLHGAIVRRLIQLGVEYDNILLTPIDTFSNPLTFSHQRSFRYKIPEQRFGVIAIPY